MILAVCTRPPAGRNNSVGPYGPLSGRTEEIIALRIRILSWVLLAFTRWQLLLRYGYPATASANAHMVHCCSPDVAVMNSLYRTHRLMTLTLTLTKTLPGSTWVPMPSLVLIGPAVQLAIGKPQTDKHIVFYMLDVHACVLSIVNNICKNSRWIFTKKTYSANAFWDRYERFGFWGQKSKV